MRTDTSTTEALLRKAEARLRSHSHVAPRNRMHPSDPCPTCLLMKDINDHLDHLATGEA